MFGTTTGLGSQALDMGPSEIMKLTVLIWTNCFRYWLTHSTKLFQVPAVYKKLQQLAEDTQRENDTALPLVAHNREGEQVPLPTNVMVLVCHCCTTPREITSSSVDFYVGQGARSFLQDPILIILSNIPLSVQSVHIDWG